MSVSRLGLGVGIAAAATCYCLSATAAPTNFDALDPPGLSPQLKILAILTILSLLPAIVLTIQFVPEGTIFRIMLLWLSAT